MQNGIQVTPLIQQPMATPSPLQVMQAVLAAMGQ